MNTKILCAYHCNAPQTIHPFMLKYPDIFVPVLSGAVNYKQGSSKLFDVFTKDDDGPNVSWTDGRFSEHTVIYWAYANYERLGNPDMIGFCHYRRILDTDYNNLDPNMVYCRRGWLQFPECARMVLLGWGGGDVVVEYMLDEYLHQFPEYKTAVECAFNSFSSYDKDMFIVSRDRFMHYMDYMVRCYRLALNPEFIKQISDWYNMHHNSQMGDYLYKRAMSIFLEALSGFYFQNLKIQNVPITLLSPVEGTFVGY